jgi:hypothetical protein
MCRWRIQQLVGPPALRSLRWARSRAGLSRATVGVLDTGYPGPLAPGPRHQPIFSLGESQQPNYGEDPHEEAPHEENDDQNC